MRHYGLVGAALTHSFSADYFERKFKEGNIQADYKLFELGSLDRLRELVEEEHLSGFNVTIPHKEQVLSYLDECDDEASEIGAVNCVQITNGILKGYNTDAHGFELSLQNTTDLSTINEALILGSGGASKAVWFSLNKLGVSCRVVSRSGTLNYDNLHEALVRECDLIINTTPLGMSPQTEQAPKIPYEAISSHHVIYDLIYNPSKTLFLSACEKRGARIKNGIEMLEIQADKSWGIWNS